jgi:hypothetical protein
MLFNRPGVFVESKDDIVSGAEIRSRISDAVLHAGSIFEWINSIDSLIYRVNELINALDSLACTNVRVLPLTSTSALRAILVPFSEDF